MCRYSIDTDTDTAVVLHSLMHSLKTQKRHSPGCISQKSKEKKRKYDWVYHENQQDSSALQSHRSDNRMNENNWFISVIRTGLKYPYISLKVWRILNNLSMCNLFSHTLQPYGLLLWVWNKFIYRMNLFMMVHHFFSFFFFLQSTGLIIFFNFFEHSFILTTDVVEQDINVILSS